MPLVDITNYSNYDEKDLCDKLKHERDVLHYEQHVQICDYLNRPSHAFCTKTFSKVQLPKEFLQLPNVKRIKLDNINNKNETSNSSTNGNSNSSANATYSFNSSNKKASSSRISATTVNNVNIKYNDGCYTKLIEKATDIAYNTYKTASDTFEESNDITSKANEVHINQSNSTNITNSNQLKPQNTSNSSNDLSATYKLVRSFTDLNESKSKSQNSILNVLNVFNNKNSAHQPIIKSYEDQIIATQETESSTALLDSYSNMIRTFQLSAAATKTLENRASSASKTIDSLISLGKSNAPTTIPPSATNRPGSSQNKFKRSATFTDSLKRTNNKSNIFLNFSKPDKLRKAINMNHGVAQTTNGQQIIDFSKSLSIGKPTLTLFKATNNPETTNGQTTENTVKPNSGNGSFFLERRNSVVINSREFSPSKDKPTKSFYLKDDGSYTSSNGTPNSSNSSSSCSDINTNGYMIKQRNESDKSINVADNSQLLSTTTHHVEDPSENKISVINHYKSSLNEYLRPKSPTKKSPPAPALRAVNRNSKIPSATQATRTTKYVIFSNNSGTPTSTTTTTSNISNVNSASTRKNLYYQMNADESNVIPAILSQNVPTSLTRANSLYNIEYPSGYKAAIIPADHHMFESMRVSGRRVSIKEQNPRMSKLTFEVGTNNNNESSALLNVSIRLKHSRLTPDITSSVINSLIK